MNNQSCGCNNDLKITVSASKLKTYKSCSLLYYYNYVIRAPQSTNEGALCGGIIHIVLECLLKDKRRKMVEKIVKDKTIKKCKVVNYYVRKEVKKLGLKKASFEKIDKFILVALNNDFYCKNGQIIGREVEFDIKNENPRYRIKGYIDVLVNYQDKFTRCKDYKSQKELFKGDDLTANIQGLMYCLAAYKLFPDRVPVTDFIMLNHEETPQQRFVATKAQLAAFEEKLSDLYIELENFQPRDRWKNVAANNSPPEDGSFGGRLLCGFAKYPGHMKKDGSKAIFHCPYRFPYDYYSLYNAEGELLKTALKKEELKPKDGERIELSSFAGCERFIKKNKD